MFDSRFKEKVLSENVLKTVFIFFFFIFVQNVLPLMRCSTDRNKLKSAISTSDRYGGCGRTFHHTHRVFFLGLFCSVCHCIVIPGNNTFYVYQRWTPSM